MPSFTPYPIIHLQLRDVNDRLQHTHSKCYMIIWLNELPLGHIWIEQDKTDHSSVFKKINEAIFPALNWYISNNTIKDQLPHLLEKKKYNEISSLAWQISKKINIPDNSLQPVSVVICTRNRPSAILNCLLSLMNCIDDNVEVIVVDNAPDNNQTELVVASFQSVKYVTENRKGLDIARNTGARYATHNIISYTDDDVTLPANWIQNIRNCFKDPLTMAVTGMVIPLELMTDAQVIFEKEWGFNKGYLPKKFDHRYFLDHLSAGVPAWDIGAGANMAFRKEAFIMAGFFDERLDVGASGCSGDSEIWYRILAEGWNCNYFPHLYVYHHHRTTLQELRSQLYHYMRGHVSALLVQYQNYGHRGNLDRIYKGLPKYYYYRIKRLLLDGNRRNNIALPAEIKGCIAGWKYFQVHKTERRHDIYSLDPVLTENVKIFSESMISVVISCFNYGNYLKQAIDSALQQKNCKVQVIVVDDGSEDNTYEVCAEYGDSIIYVRVERVGLSATRNIGVRFSSGNFIVFLDADDFLYENALNTNLYYFSLYPESAFVSGAHILIDSEGNSLPSNPGIEATGNTYIKLLQGNYIGMEATVMYRRAIFDHFHFDTALSSCEDYDFNLQVARIFPVCSHNKTIAVYRIHPNNMSGNKNHMLTAARKVLVRQQKLLCTQAEREAFSLGLKNWADHYAL